MIGIVEFITARLDEDEAAVAAPESWSAADESHGVRRVDVDLSSECVAASTRSWRAEHIARHDPARVLAEVKAKRAIVKFCDEDPLFLEGGWAYTDRVLRLMASAYADHPDYDPAWRVA